MFERISRAGETQFCEARRGDAGACRQPRVQRLGHSAEIGDDAGTLGCADGNGHRCFFCIQPAQRSARGRSTQRAEYAGRMPAFLVLLHRVAPREVSVHFVAGGVGKDHLPARCAEGFRLCEYGRYQRRARMAAALRDVIVVKRVRSGAVDPRCIERRRAAIAEQQRGLRTRGRQHFPDQLRRRVITAGDGAADAIGDHQFDCRHGFSGDVFVAHTGNKLAEFFGQFNGHDCSRLVGCTMLLVIWRYRDRYTWLCTWRTARRRTACSARCSCSGRPSRFFQALSASPGS